MSLHGRKWLIAVLIPLVALLGPEAPSHAQSQTQQVDIRVWQGTSNPRVLAVNVRPEGSAWADFAAVFPDMAEPSGRGRHRHGAVSVADVDVWVWQRVSDLRILYISVRPARGSWAGVDPIRVDLDSLSRSGRSRFGDVTVTLPVLPPPEERAAARLAEIAPWFENPPEGPASEAAEILTALWILDPSLGEAAASAEWMRRPVTSWALNHLRALRDLASQDPSAARVLAHLPWFSGWLNEGEQRVVHKLAEIASVDPHLAKALTGVPWLADSVSTRESYLLWHLQQLAFIDPRLATMTAGLPWFYDSITEYESAVPVWLVRIARVDVELAVRVAGWPVTAQAVTQDSSWALEALASMAEADVPTARVLADAAWFTDSITPNELEATFRLLAIAIRDPGLARLLAGFSWFSDGRDSDLHRITLNALTGVVISAPEALPALVGESWFRDGLDDREAAFVATLRRPAILYPRLYEDLLKEHYLETDTITLPLAGEVRIWLVRNTPPPPQHRAMSTIKGAVSASESFLGVPFPTRDLIVSFITPRWHSIEQSATQTGDMVFLARGDQVSIRTIVHEIAHFYTVGPLWLREGAADFLTSIYMDTHGIRSLAEVKESLAETFGCLEGSNEEVVNIRQLNLRFVRQETGCHYTMGQFFLHSMSDAIGEEAVSAALNELYTRHNTRELGLLRRITEEVIYEVFLKHAPVDRRESFKETYRRIHGGRYAFPDDSFADDHADDLFLASPAAVGEVVEGTLDYRFDVDCFRFPAEEGQTYRLSVAHPGLHVAGIDLRSEEHLELPRLRSEEWISRRKGEMGPEIVWTAPRSADFFVQVRNVGNESGTYTLTITPIDE